MLHNAAEFTPDKLLHPAAESVPANIQTPQATALDAMAGDGGYQEEKYLGNYLRFKMQREGKRFWAGDNISEYVTEENKERLINEAAEAFETVLDR